VKLAFTFGESLFDERTAARLSRLAHIKRLARLGFSNWRCPAGLWAEKRCAAWARRP
jgi:hypothetical protein